MVNKSESNEVLQISPFLRWGVLLIGLVLLLLLFFADKTNLNNRPNAAIQSGDVPSGKNSTSKLPPLPPDNQWDTWMIQLKERKGEEKLLLLDSIVVNLQTRRRYAYASNYAMEAFGIDSSLQNQLRLGILSYQAMSLPYVAEDSSLLQVYATRSIASLESVLLEQPDQEDAMLFLGLAKVSAGIPGQSMQGILQLRKLTEINPDHIEANFHLGRFSLQTGQLDKAIARFEKVLSLDTTNQDARFQLAVCYLRQNQKDKALPLLQLVAQYTNDPALKLEAQSLIDKNK